MTSGPTHPKHTRCIVCRQPNDTAFEETLRAYWGLCRACARSYDRARDKDATTLALITWAANRAWVSAQKKTKVQP
jgi:hypothetical protein